MMPIFSILATIILPGSALFFVSYTILAAEGIPLAQRFGAIQALAVLAGLAGVYLIARCAATCGRVSTGAGARKPALGEPPNTLAREGLYRRVRNPMYAGAILILLAEAAYFGSVCLFIYTLGLWALFHIFLRVIEEPRLVRRLGEEYARYQAEVPRWIPKLR